MAPVLSMGSPHCLVWAAIPVASVPGAGPVLCWPAVNIYHFEKTTVSYSGEKNRLSGIQEQFPRLLGKQPWEIKF